MDWLTLEKIHRLVTKPKNLIWFLFLIFFVFSTLFTISLASELSQNPILEIFKWLQFASLIIICFLFFNKINRWLGYFIASFLNFFYFILVTYILFAKSRLDFNFLIRNINDIASLLGYFFYLLLSLALLAVINSVVLHQAVRPLWQKRLGKIAICVFFLSVFILPNHYKNEMAIFAQSIYHQDKVIEYYQDFYQNFLKHYGDDKNLELQKWQQKATSTLPSYLDNIIVLQLESFNGLLVGPTTTPNYYTFAQNNTYFPKFYGNNVQTILGQENILCSVPGSFDSTLVNTGQDKKIACLPKMLRAAGYKNFFFQTYGLSFANTGNFMKNIGFDEVHAEDLMKPTDPKYLWGYREDVFYNRVFDYLQNNTSTRNFFYIAVCSTNHWPFKLPADVNSFVPYPKSQDFKEKLINTSYLQDNYLGIALDRIKGAFPSGNYTIIIVGDHSWPFGIHKNNTFNEWGYYEENFTTSLTLQVGQEKNYQHRIINDNYSQMDIVPSLKDLFGISYETSTYYRSFIKPTSSTDNKIIMIQPFSEKCLNILNLKDNRKGQYNSLNGKFTAYDLNSDPWENDPHIISSDASNNLKNIEEWLK
ncbi:MAG: LTA synthase family protein [Patescibacteria group bacterium]